MAEEPGNSNSLSVPQDTTSSPATQDSTPLNEDLIKSAVSFLSSPNVQSADTAKKVAFLTKKGLSAKEVEEAFKRVKQPVPSVSVSSVAPTTAVAPPAPLIPTRPAYQPGQPSVIYQPMPPAPSLPIQQVVALAVLFGVGAVSVTAGIVGIVKRLLLPTFKAAATYQTGRYQQQKEVLDKLSSQLAGEETETVGDQKAADVHARLAEKQAALAERLEHMVKRAKDRQFDSEHTVGVYTGLGTAVAGLRNTINSPEYMYTPSLYTAPGLEKSKADGLKGEIRSLKGILLSRRR